MNLGIESETLEFKKSTGEIEKAVDNIASMLNKHGHEIDITPTQVEIYNPGEFPQDLTPVMFAKTGSNPCRETRLF